jgi:hypothetical protein
VVLVEDDEVPVLLANPLVLRLDAPVPVPAEEVLEGAEAHDGALLVGRLVLLGDVGPARLLGAADELPALEVDVRGEVLLPSRLDGGLEGENETRREAHVLGELVGGEGLAEAHLRVPEELRRACAALASSTELKYSSVLCTAASCSGRMLKSRVRRSTFSGPVAHGDVGSPHVVDGAAEPLGLLPVAVPAGA